MAKKLTREKAFHKGWYRPSPYGQQHYFKSSEVSLCGIKSSKSDIVKSPDRPRCIICQSKTGEKNEKTHA